MAIGAGVIARCSVPCARGPLCHPLQVTTRRGRRGATPPRAAARRHQRCMAGNAPQGARLRSGGVGAREGKAGRGTKVHGRRGGVGCSRRQGVRLVVVLLAVRPAPLPRPLHVARGREGEWVYIFAHEARGGRPCDCLCACDWPPPCQQQQPIHIPAPILRADGKRVTRGGGGGRRRQHVPMRDGSDDAAGTVRRLEVKVRPRVCVWGGGGWGLPGGAVAQPRSHRPPGAPPPTPLTRTHPPNTHPPT